MNRRYLHTLLIQYHIAILMLCHCHAFDAFWLFFCLLFCRCHDAITLIFDVYASRFSHLRHYAAFDVFRCCCFRYAAAAFFSLMPFRRWLLHISATPHDAPLMPAPPIFFAYRYATDTFIKIAPRRQICRFDYAARRFSLAADIARRRHGLHNDDASLSSCCHFHAAFRYDYRYFAITPSRLLSPRGSECARRGRRCERGRGG